MTSERQIVANRRNARKSTGPRSGAGRKRANGNAYRHGLSARSTLSEAFAKEIDHLAGKLAGDTQSAMTLARARAAAEAELELARVRQTKIAMIEGAGAFRDLDPSQASNETEMVRLCRKPNRLPSGPIKKPKRIRPDLLPSPEPDRQVEALRRVLPDLLKLDRYERRAASRRDRAIRELSTNR